MKSKTAGERAFDAINYLLVGILTLFFLYPVWYVLMASISNPAKLMVHTGPLLLPNGFSLEGYEAVHPYRLYQYSVLRRRRDSFQYVSYHAGRICNLPEEFIPAKVSSSFLRSDHVCQCGHDP